MKRVFSFHLLLSIMQTQRHFQFRQMDRKTSVSEAIKDEMKHVGKPVIPIPRTEANSKLRIFE